MNILITGFEAFLKNEKNPTEEIIKLLPSSIYGNQITKIILPVVYDECFDKLLPIIQEIKPDVIINLGLAGGRKAISLERIAININDSLHQDNKGNIILDCTIDNLGDKAYFSTLPIKQIMENIQAKNIPVEISNSAGTYVCNNLMYHVLRYISYHKLSIKAGFIHVPFMSEQVNKSEGTSLPLDVILEGVIDSIKTCL